MLKRLESECRAVANTAFVFAALFSFTSLALAILAMFALIGRREFAAFALVAASAAVCLWTLWVMVTRALRHMDEQLSWSPRH